tara:strand:- start:1113 stop:1436 length:324 start_codon:yes stop_codon:yes gene_type:complete
VRIVLDKTAPPCKNRRIVRFENDCMTIGAVGPIRRSGIALQNPATDRDHAEFVISKVSHPIKIDSIHIACHQNPLANQRNKKSFFLNSSNSGNFSFKLKFSKSLKLS